MAKKLTYEFVKEQFEKEGYELLSKEYVNAQTKLIYRCPKGHFHSITWASWQQGVRCSICFNNKQRLSINFIRNFFKKEGYILLTKKYKDANQKLGYICPKGHEHCISWGKWQQGHRCAYCANRGKPTIEFITSEFEKENYKLLTKVYVNCEQKLEYICPKGHKHSISWSKWRQGKRCPYCAGNGKPAIEFIKLEFEKEGYTLLSKKYVNSSQKLRYICPVGHRHIITWHHWSNGRRCPYCATIISKGEIEVRDFAKSLGVNVLSNNRKQVFNPHTGYGLELDIWMPNIGKAIEYNGEYWHNRPEVVSNDALKQCLCKQNNIDLLVVWDYEWLSNNNACKNKIKKFVASS